MERKLIERIEKGRERKTEEPIEREREKKTEKERQKKKDRKRKTKKKMNNMIKCQPFILRTVYLDLTKSILFIFDDNREVVVAVEDVAVVVELKVANRPVTSERIFLRRSQDPDPVARLLDQVEVLSGFGLGVRGEHQGNAWELGQVWKGLAPKVKINFINTKT